MLPVDTLQQSSVHLSLILQQSSHNTCGVCSSATIKARHIILDFDMLSEIITFEEKGRFSKEKHQNLGVKIKLIGILPIGSAIGKNCERLMIRFTADIIEEFDTEEILDVKWIDIEDVKNMKKE